MILRAGIVSSFYFARLRSLPGEETPEYFRSGQICTVGCFQQPGQVAVGIQLIFQRCLDHRKYHCTASSPLGRIGKQKVLPVNHKGLYASLSTVVGVFQSTVPQIVDQIRPLLLQIDKRLAQGLLWCCCSGICPCQQSVQNRFCLLQPLDVSFFRRKAAERLLQFKQLIAISQALCGGTTLYLPFGQRFDCFVKLPPGMDPADDHGDFIRKIVVSGITVRVEVAPKAGQKCFWMPGAPARLVFVQDNGLVRISTGPVQPHVALTLGLFVRFMPDRLTAAKAQLDNLYQQQAAAKEEVGKPFPYEDEQVKDRPSVVEQLQKKSPVQQGMKKKQQEPQR